MLWAQELQGRTFVHPQASSHPALLGLLSRRWEDEKFLRSQNLGLLILHQAAKEGHCLRTAQLCLDPFCASFCSKGKEKYLFTHTQEPGWAVRPLETQRGLCPVLRLLWAVKKAQKPYKNHKKPYKKHKKPYKNVLCPCPGTNLWVNPGTSWGLPLKALTEEIPPCVATELGHLTTTTCCLQIL